MYLACELQEWKRNKIVCMRVVVCLSWSVVAIYDCFVSVGLHVGEFRSSASKHQAVTLRPDRGDMILALACIGGGSDLFGL